jgi:hypothetical protein
LLRLTNERDEEREENCVRQKNLEETKIPKREKSEVEEETILRHLSW